MAAAILTAVPACFPSSARHALPCDVLLSLSLLMLMFTTMLAIGCATTNHAAPTHLTVDIAGERFKLKLAMDDNARFRGLSDVKEIAPAGGMLFVFPDVDHRTFVMRKCLVPLDIIFLGPGGRIVSMHEMELEPYDTPEHQLKPYHSGWPAQFAIELHQGTIKRLNLKPGQKIDLPEELKAAAG